MEAEQRAQRLGEGEREPVVERGVFEKRLAGDARHQPVAREVHLLHDLDGDDVEGAPGIVADQPRRDERQGDQEQDCVRRG